MPTLKYDIVEYAKRRLHNTIITVDNNPAHIRYDVNWYYFVHYLDKNLGVKRLDLKRNRDKIDITPVQLGFINHRNDAIYLSRMPCRRWTQGLSDENLIVKGIINPRINEYEIFENICNEDYLLQPINNKYPTIHEAIDKRIPTAFGREFGLDPINGRLYYRGNKEIGKLGLNRIILFKKYNFLKSSLMEVIK